VRLLAGREHSRAELQRKLLGRGYAAEYVELTLDELARQGLQSDQRYTEQYVSQRRDRGYGPRRIQAELRERGIAPALVEAWLDERDPAWWGQLQAVAAARFGTQPPADQRELAKRVRFLEYRGFAPEQIRRLLLD
jgi:regulatory protein